MRNMVFFFLTPWSNARARSDALAFFIAFFKLLNARPSHQNGTEIEPLGFRHFGLGFRV